MNINSGKEMYSLAKTLYPICRSLTGNGVRETLEIIKNIIPDLIIHEIPSGTSVFDWVVPEEWNIKGGWIETMNGERVIDFQNNNLHILGYSTPINMVLSREELFKHIYTLPDQPDLIPYVTSYYTKRWGFCMSENQKNNLCDEKYRVVIDSTLENGSLTYADLIIPGETTDEIFFSTYVCHPSMANNEISGPVVVTELIKFIQQLPNRRFTYRIVFIPETIGSIVYLDRNFDLMKQRIKAGFVVTCVGDAATYSYVASRYGNTLADKVAKNVLQFHAPNYKSYSYLHRGSDERQYCAPGIDLPVCSICRSKYGEYSEYHTSADNLSFISEDGLFGAFNVYKQICIILEANYYYEITCKGEPQLGKRGLYPPISIKGTYNEVKAMSDFLAYSDGSNDLIDISNIINQPVERLLKFIDKLLDNKLIIKH